MLCANRYAISLYVARLHADCKLTDLPDGDLCVCVGTVERVINTGIQAYRIAGGTLEVCANC